MRDRRRAVANCNYRAIDEPVVLRTTTAPSCELERHPAWREPAQRIVEIFHESASVRRVLLISVLALLLFQSRCGRFETRLQLRKAQYHQSRRGRYLCPRNSSMISSTSGWFLKMDPGVRSFRCEVEERLHFHGHQCRNLKWYSVDSAASLPNLLSIGFSLASLRRQP